MQNLSGLMRKMKKEIEKGKYRKNRQTNNKDCY